MGVIFLDHYLLPKTELTDSIYSKTKESSRRKFRSRYIRTASGDTYPVSEKTYKNLVRGQQVTLHKTILFRKNVTISWCYEKDCNEASLQGFLDKYTGALLLLVPLFLLLPGLFNLVNISSGRAQFVYYFGLVWAVFTIVIFFAS